MKYDLKSSIINRFTRFLHHLKTQNELYNLRNYEITIIMKKENIQNVRLLRTNFNEKTSRNLTN